MMNMSERDRDQVPQSEATPGERGKRPSVRTAEEIQAWLIEQLSERWGIRLEEVDVRKPLERYGLSSEKALALSGDLGLAGASAFSHVSL
jgi:hypothetical protein